MPELNHNLSFAYDLVNRVVPWLNQHVQFGISHKSNGDAASFELYSKDGIVHINGSDQSALGFGLNYYLKYYCHRSMSHTGSHLLPQWPIPMVEESVRINTPFEYRYALNYCTFDYSMPFWSWAQWERELDWMALNGVNLMLLVTGTRAIWKKVLAKYHFTSKEIQEFLPGPVYNAWWLMGNLEGWGGMATECLIDQQVELTRKILDRMNELGITPIFHGYYGIVPRSMKKKFPKAPISVQGYWNQVFERPDIVDCKSPLFKEIATAYYDTVKELYGDIQFFAGDPFHEGGNVEGLNIGEQAAAIQQSMQKAFPESTWVLQAWYNNPRADLLQGIPQKEKVLILDLFGEVTSEWKNREAFGNIPFVWCSINNFGERPGIYGRLEKIAEGPREACNSKFKPYMKGIGAAPEGILNNPVVYDLIFDAAWRPFEFKVKDWLPAYSSYRYGKFDDKIISAWNIFLETAYRSDDKYQEGPSETVFCARPSLLIPSASTWGTRVLYYDTAHFEKGVRLFAEAARDFRAVETYRYDLVDFTRQVLANRGQFHYDALVKAFNDKNRTSYEKHSQAFLSLMLMQDELLSTHADFMLGKWLRDAWYFMEEKSEKYVCDWNARVLVTYWGPDNPQTSLHDYAHKEWAGLIKDFYYPRWKMFLDSLHWELMGMERIELNFFSFETSWANQRKEYAVMPAGDCIKTAARILKKIEKREYANIADN